jgi:hypothetical protein
MGADGALYIANFLGVVSVTPDGLLHYVTAGSGGTIPGDGRGAKQVNGASAGLALDGQGALLLTIAQSNAVTWRLTSGGSLHHVMDTYFDGELVPLDDGTFLRPASDTNQILRYSPGSATLGNVAPHVVVAGLASRGNSDDGGPGTQALMEHPGGVATDSSGNLYVTDSYAGRIRKLDTNGVITTIAGIDGTATPDGTPALKSVLNYPTGIAVNASGEVF